MKRKTTKRKVTRRVTRSVQVMVTKTIVQCEWPYVLFGEELRRQRLLKDWTQQQLADRMELCRASIANIEIGRQRVLLGDLFDFAKALGVRPRLFFDAVMPPLWMGLIHDGQGRADHPDRGDQEETMSEREPYDGHPYYCIECDAGYREYLACETAMCELENKCTAEARARLHKCAPPTGSETERE